MSEDPLKAERDRLERDRQKLREDREEFERARVRQLEEIRERERQRDRERERDREEFRDRERRRRAQAAQDRRAYVPKYRTTRVAGPGPSLVLQDLERLAYAWTRTGVETVIGLNQAMGNLALNLTDSIWGRRAEGSTVYRRETVGSTRPRSVYAESFDDEVGCAPGKRRVYRVRTEPEPEVTRETSSLASDVSVDVSNAVRESAHVLTRSAENFSRIFEEETERDDVRDELDDVRDELDDDIPRPVSSRTVTERDDPLKERVRRDPDLDRPLR